MDTVNILLPYGYDMPTEDDVRDAKRWTRERNDNAAALAAAILLLLKRTSKELIQIAYQYSCAPEQWQFSQNKALRERVAVVMSELEGKILAKTEKFSLALAGDEKQAVRTWMLSLKSKGCKDLQSTLHARLTQWLYDTEAQIAAVKLAGYDVSKAVNRIPPAMKSVYTMPEVLAAFKKNSAARFIRSKGVHHDNRGLSSSGANNVESFAYQTAVKVWEHTRYVQMKDSGMAGYVCIRGSNFPCGACDDVCYIFHPIEEGMVLPVHSHCCCVAIYIKNL